MARVIRRVFLAGLVPILGAGYAVVHYRNRASAIATTQQWARLAAFPVNSSVLDVRVKGSMFTREFEVSFSASSEVIARWIEQSPGLREARISTNADGSKHFLIRPGARAAFA